MKTYLSQHTDYTNANLTKEVDAPAKPLVCRAKNAKEAMKAFFAMEETLPGGYKPSLEEIADETTLVLLDPVFEELRKLGWTITPPEKS